MDTQKYVDRLLENENLTGDLEDEEADWLMKWGIQQLTIVTDGLIEAEAANEKVSALMTFMRRVGRTAARKNSRTPEELVENLQELSSFYARAFGSSRPISQDEYAEAT